MKTLLLSFLCCLVVFRVCAADTPFIPGTLNELIPKIHAGMTDQKVGAVLARAYPHVAYGGGFGGMDEQFTWYNLDERFSLGIFFALINSKYVVSDPITFSILDTAVKRRWDIKIVNLSHRAK